MKILEIDKRDQVAGFLPAESSHQDALGGIRFDHPLEEFTLCLATPLKRTGQKTAKGNDEALDVQWPWQIRQ